MKNISSHTRNNTSTTLLASRSAHGQRIVTCFSWFALYHLVRRQHLHNLNEYANVILEPATSYSLQVLPRSMCVWKTGPYFFYYLFIFILSLDGHFNFVVWVEISMKFFFFLSLNINENWKLSQHIPNTIFENVVPYFGSIWTWHDGLFGVIQRKCKWKCNTWLLTILVLNKEAKCD